MKQLAMPNLSINRTTNQLRWLIPSALRATRSGGGLAPTLGIMKPSPQFIVYLVGAAVFGLFYAPVKSALGGQWLFLLSAVGYLLVLRLLGVWLAKLLTQKEAK